MNSFSNSWARGPAWSGRLLVTEEIEGSNPFGPAFARHSGLRRAKPVGAREGGLRSAEALAKASFASSELRRGKPAYVLHLYPAVCRWWILPRLYKQPPRAN